MDTLKIFENLIGTWDFKRTIVDSTTRILISNVTGQASFKLIFANHLHYLENGTVALGQQQFNSSQEYIYYYNYELQTIKKYFAMNKEKLHLFYELQDFDAHSWRGLHQCRNDRYLANYAGLTPKTRDFKLTYQATGPHKNYLITTNYCKVFT